MKPSVGRIVHFVFAGVHFAAIITKVWNDDCVNLYVFDDGCNSLAGKIQTSVMFSDLKLEFSWHWPEIV